MHILYMYNVYVKEVSLTWDKPRSQLTIVRTANECKIYNF